MRNYNEHTKELELKLKLREDRDKIRSKASFTAFREKTVAAQSLDKSDDESHIQSTLAKIDKKLNRGKE